MNGKKLLNVVLVLVFLVSSAPNGSSYASHPLISNDASGPDTTSAVPAPTGFPTPTIHLSISHGYVGQSVIVTGNVPSHTYPGVRVSWVISDTTYTTSVVAVNPDLTYQATTGVPYTLETGPAKVCATLTGTDIAEYACQNFTLDLAPNGSVSGVLPTSGMSAGGAEVPDEPGTQTTASVNLMNRAGTILYSGSVDGTGVFSIPNVSPGVYQIAATGNVAQTVVSGPVIVNPGSGTIV